MKIKTVGSETRGREETQVDRQVDPLALPPEPRVRHEICPGLWLFEEEDGQTYLAVKTTAFQPRGKHSYVTPRF